MKITFPNGDVKDVQEGKTPLEIVLEHIGEGLARVAIVAKVDGELYDLNRPVTKDCKLEILKFEDDEGRDVFWHSSTHLMAQAVKELFPDAKLTIGPVVADGFFYDMEHAPFQPEDLPKIEEKMKEIRDRKLEVTRLELTKEEALETFKDNPYKIEIINEADKEVSLQYVLGLLGF